MMSIVDFPTDWIVGIGGIVDFNQPFDWVKWM
jgi:hypothetical protein